MAAVTVRITIDRPALERETGRDMRAFHRSMTRRIATQARADVPVRTGNLGRTVGELPQTSTPTRVDGGVEATADHAAPVHEGSRAHRITGRNGGALRFTVGGRVLFRRSVWHPGVRPRPFLRNAAHRVAATDPRVG